MALPSPPANTCCAPYNLYAVHESKRRAAPAGPGQLGPALTLSKTDFHADLFGRLVGIETTRIESRSSGMDRFPLAGC